MAYAQVLRAPKTVIEVTPETGLVRRFVTASTGGRPLCYDDIVRIATLVGHANANGANCT